MSRQFLQGSRREAVLALWFSLAVAGGLLVGCDGREPAAQYSSVVVGEAGRDGGAWPRFRGPVGDSVVTAPDFDPARTTLPSEPTWTTDIGSGYAAPSVSNGLVYTLGNTMLVDTVRCLRLSDGEEVWSYSYSARSGSYPGPRSTPTIHDGKLYTLSRDGTLICFDADSGSIIWQRNISRDGIAWQAIYDYASSVVVWNDLLLINANRSGLALRAEDGELAWTSSPAGAAYATPVVAEIGGRTQALFLTSSGMHGVDPATGEELWASMWLAGSFDKAADPLPVGNRVFSSTAYGLGCALLEIDGSDATTVWQNNIFESHFASFVYSNGYIYGNSGSPESPVSYFRCVEFDRGRERWSAEADGSGSLIAVGRYLIMLTERGRVVFAELTPDEYRPVAEMSAPRGIYWTAPVYADGRLLLRDAAGALYCYEL